MNIHIKVGVLIVNNNKLLLIKEKINKKDKPLWNIIKGTYEINSDENIFTAAIRECREEISVEVNLVNSLGCYITKGKDDLHIQFNFLAEIIKGKPAIPSKSEQIERKENVLEFNWFGEDEIINMKSESFISNRAYTLVNDWIAGCKYPLDIFQLIK